MPIMVMYHLSASPEAMEEAWEANSELFPVFMEAAEKAGSKRHGSLVGDGKVIELEEYPSREAFDQFQADVKEANAKIDAHMGNSPKVEVFEFHPPEEG